MTSDKHVRTRSGISWFALLLGIALGVSAGLIYTWEIDPVVERNTAPWQLSAEGREQYVVAVALSYTYNHDLNLAFDRLRGLRPDQPVWDMVAQIACDRHKTGKTVTNSDIRVMRALEQLYRSQGASGCADGLYPTPAPVVFATLVPTVVPTPTLTPPFTKTPTPPRPTATPFQVSNPTAAASQAGRFVLGRLQSFCDPDLDGVIEVRVYDRLGNGLPGVPVTVSWGGAERDSFFTGLKPERDAGFADYDMEAGRSYTVSIPGLASSAPSVDAVPCETTEDNQTVTTTASYWINFQQQAN